MNIGGIHMYAVKFKKRNSDDFQVYICKSRSVKGKKSKLILERFPSYLALGTSDKERDKFINDKIAALSLSEKERKEKTTTLNIDFNKTITSDLDTHKNIGYLFLQKMWSTLKIDSFLSKWIFDNKIKIEYTLNDVLRLLCFSRVIDPGSKIYTLSLKDNYLESFNDLNKNNIFDALDRINFLSNKLTKRLSKECSNQMSVNSDSVYYDCTNFYFEIQNADDEEGIRDYGVEKNHRPDPIVEYGLLYDERGFPIGSIVFKGSESEKTSLGPALISAGEEITKGKIVCADGGLNTKYNKELIHKTGRNYIFCQGIKGISNPKKKKGLEHIESDYEWAINGKNMTIYSKRGEPIKAYKERWIKRPNGVEERLIVKFDQSSQKFMLKTIDKRIERAQKFLKNPTLLEFKNCHDGKQYIDKVVIDKKTGEISKAKSQLTLNEEKINKERKEAGYYCFVTDIPREYDLQDKEIRELIKNGLRYEPKSAIEILKIAGKRVEIEECFRMMKTNLTCRPIYVWTKEHIKAHLFTVYLALVLISFMKVKYEIKLSNQRLLEIMRKFNAIEVKEGIYKVIYYNNDVKYLLEKFNLKELSYEYFDNKTRRNVIAKAKNIS